MDFLQVKAIDIQPDAAPLKLHVVAHLDVQ
jgi:hypothetical protein